MGNIFEKPKKPIKKQKKILKKKMNKKKSMKKQKGGMYSNNPRINDLFEKMLKNLHGWDVMSNRKPVATMNSGDPFWFVNTYKTFNEEERNEFKRCISSYLSEKNGYDSPVEIYFTYTNNRNYRILFYLPDFFRIACDLIGVTLEEGIELIRFGSNNHPQKMIFIYLVFGDYYKKYFKETAIETPGFMELFRAYNERVGVVNANSIPLYNIEY